MLQTRVKSRPFDLMMKGPRYVFSSLRSMPYHADVVEHLLRYYWPVILGLYMRDEDICAMHADLTSAIKQLPDLQRRAVLLVLQGYDVRGDEENGIAPRLGCSAEQVSDILKTAYRAIAHQLEG